MTKLTVTTAALAVGLTTFAASAKDTVLAWAPANGDSNGELANGAIRSEKAVEPLGKTAEEIHHDSKAVMVRDRGPIRTAKVAAQKDEPGQPYGTIIERYAVQMGLSVSLAHAVVRLESNYRPYALGRAGEVGLMQIKPATARMMGYAGSMTGLFDPERNIKYGMKYLAKAQKLGDGTICGTILKYNGGHAAKRMNPVSLDYCHNVKRHLALEAQRRKWQKLIDQYALKEHGLRM
ncbi:lytic transglycosylase domain-containing protein [Mesorhizobium escarrei]|uniref:Lytic transglycosylase, catalytic n=1 Tax=Mesorhizobium escarrei TaxID=666018 RepID=A0ABN8JCK8_9HYPH|nr:transglycosylase SLT domain-containing protein [Mesorhizobium escarrei]CAH2395139.1 Lytic transglycosylase, catalytic [Mesorhizobium escarrei]